MRAAVGPRADFYLRKWERSERGGFNWAAFFCSGVWLPFRKMYRATAILYAAVIIESVLEDLVFVGWLGMPETPRALERGVGWAVCCVCGGFGNMWYLSHVKHLVAATRATVPNEDQCLDTLRKRGGTTMLGALGLFAVFVMAIIAAMLVTDAVVGRS
jgi:hypothetical protein